MFTMLPSWKYNKVSTVAPLTVTIKVGGNDTKMQGVFADNGKFVKLETLEAALIGNDASKAEKASNMLEAAFVEASQASKPALQAWLTLAANDVKIKIDVLGFELEFTSDQMEQLKAIAEEMEQGQKGRKASSKSDVEFDTL